MADEREEENCKIKVVVKTSNSKETIETEPTASIREFKDAVSGKFNAPVAQLCLIFAGRILKDEETLDSYAIKDGLTVHLVIKSENRAQQQAAQHATHQPAQPPQPSHQASPPPASSQSQPTPSLFGSGLGGMDGLAGLGGMSGNSGNLQQMSQQLMANPDLMRQVMDNPMVQSMMSNPDLVRQMILSNPQMQQLIERNPEISHILNNPDLMRQTMEMVRNPSLMQEVMRNHDRALSNLESLPGGFNALQRMYTEVQEPMLNATQEQMQSNPFSALFGASGAGTGIPNPNQNPQQGTENTSPLPNPWASGTPATPGRPAVQQSTPQTMASSTPSSTVTGANASAAPGGNTGSTAATPQSTPMSGMFQTPAMQSLMQQMSGNSDMFQNMMQSPYMQEMMGQMAQNPELMASMIRSNPMFQGNSQLADQVSSRLPEFMTQMQNPDVQQAMTNPRVMQALMQIQQGMMQLQTEAPGLVPGTGMMGGVPPPVRPSTTGSTTATPNTTAAPPTQTTGAPADPQRTTQGGTQGSTQGSAQGSAQGNPMAQLMAQMMQGAPADPQSTTQGGTPGSTQGSAQGSAQGNPMAQLMSQMMQAMTQQTQNPPEVTYRSQLDQLAQMGFVDRARNIQALVATGGDLNAAIERLLQ